MRKISIITLAILCAITGYAQTPVSWTYNAQKVAGDLYEIHITATINPGWHVYSQHQPEDAIALPTTLHFVKNPLIVLDGKVKEKGQLQRETEPTLGITQYQYENKVVFVQVVKLKGRVAATNVSGSIEYQACTDQMCLPPATEKFSIALKG